MVVLLLTTVTAGVAYLALKSFLDGRQETADSKTAASFTAADARYAARKAKETGGGGGGGGAGDERAAAAKRERERRDKSRGFSP